MKYTTTNIYRKDELIRREKATTLEEYIKYGRLEPGQYILIGEIKYDGDCECHINTEELWVGNCTPHHQPSDNDFELGWAYNSPLLKKIVLEVHTYQ